jgi:hypothetical protein
MAYREHGMWEVLEVLRRKGRGESSGVIQAATGRSRSTIRRYVALARDLGWKPDEGEVEEKLAGEVAARLRPGPRERGPGESEERLGPHREQICTWLKAAEPGRGLTLTKVHKLLRRQGVEVPYSSLHRYAVQHCGFGRRRLTVRMAPVAPGELAEVDFGRLGLIWDPQRERQRLVHALIVTLVYSRHQYVHCSHGQKLEDLIAGLEEAWEFFEGVVARVVVDNLKAAVTKADRYDPALHRSFEEYARHRGFVIDPAVVRHPQGKPHVERGVPYVRESLFRGENWIDLDHLQREAQRWCRQEAGMRIHGTTRQRPLVVFEEEEKAALIPLEKGRYDVPGWAECKVHPDRHIQFQKATYSVPSRYVGRQITVRGDRSLVRLYFQGEQIKTHATQPPGGRSTDHDDYPQELTPYTLRDPDRLIRRAATIGEQTEHFVAELLGGTFPWANLRQAQKLFRLAEKYGPTRMEAACARAVSFELINVRRLERILVHGIEATAETPPAKQSTLLPLPARYLRPGGSFTHAHSPEENHDHGDRPILEEGAQEAPALGHRADPARSHQLRRQEEAATGRLPGTGAPGRD